MDELVKKPDEHEELQALLAATDKTNPTPQALQALRKFLATHPGSCRAVGDLALQVREQILDNALPKAAGVIMSVKAHMEKLSDELGYDDASAIEQMVIETILLSWLRLYVCENRYEMTMQQNLTIVQGNYWERKLSSHQARYLRSIEPLARVKRLVKEPRSPAFNVLLAQQFNGR